MTPAGSSARTHLALTVAYDGTDFHGFAAQPETRPPQKLASNIRDILVSIQGQQTNIGVLVKVAGDYVVFESEGDTLMYPLCTVQVVKFMKVEEGEARKIEIKFLSKD